MNYKNSLRARVALPCLILGAGFLAVVATTPAAEPGETIVVTATRTGQSSFVAPAAIDAVEAPALREHKLRVNFSEGMGRVPGLNVQNRYNYAQDLQVSSRGFGARASFGVRGVRLLQDGIPLTMPDGQGQTGLFDLDSADRVEVLRGPFAALYGNSSGAVIQLFTAPVGQPRLEATGVGAEYGTWRLESTFATKLSGLDASGNVSRFETDGVREHSAAQRDVANLKLRYAPGGRSSVTFIVNALDQPDTQDPLGLTQAQVESNPRQAGTNAIALDTRKSTRHVQGGLSWQYELSDDDRLRVAGYGGDRDLVQYLANPSTALTGSGGVVDLARTFGGVSTQWDHSGQLGGSGYDLTLGAEYDRMKEHRLGYVNVNGTKGDLRREEDDTVYDVNAYAIAQWRPLQRWTFSGGARYSEVNFEIDDHFIVGPNPDDSGTLSFSSTQPVVGALFAVTPRFNLFASGGRAFETPTLAELAYRPDGSPGINTDLQASTSNNYELGAKMRLGDHSRLNGALFRSDTRQDIVTGPAPFPGRNTFVNAARTRREGAELSLQTSVRDGWDFNLAYTYTRARFEEFVNFAGLDLGGRSIPGVPEQSGYVEINWRPGADGFSAGLEARWVDRVYVNDINSAFTDDYAVLNLHAGWRQRFSGWDLSAFVRLDNVTDENYVGSVIVNAANDRYFEPSPGRYLYFGVTAGFAQ